MRIFPRSNLFILLLGLPLTGLSQHAPGAAKIEPNGIITGRVYCADTNAPARMAHVGLVPTRDVDKFSTSSQPPGVPENDPVNFVSSDLEGHFTMSSVKPGSYYLVAEKEGFLSPVQQFTSEELSKPTPEVKQRIGQVLQKVTVEGNETATVELRLERGAAISGQVSFDDGSPAAGLVLRILRKSSDGKWEPNVLSALDRFGIGNTRTDDRGAYRIAGLPAGEYLVRAELTIEDQQISSFLGAGAAISSNDRFTLTVYSGSVMRLRGATPVKVGAGEELHGEDILIPLAKLHTVSGALTSARDGHAVNAAKITLLYADDKAELTSVQLDKQDLLFRFPYVPEGDYLLKVTDAGDVDREVIAYPPGTFPPTFTRETRIHDYGPVEQSLIVHGDETTVSLSVPDKPSNHKDTPP